MARKGHGCANAPAGSLALQKVAESRDMRDLELTRPNCALRHILPALKRARYGMGDVNKRRRQA
jgi:hypothetical protein